MTTISQNSNVTWREWTGLALVALPLFMMATDFSVLFLAIPSIAADLAPSTTQMLWIMHVGEFVTAGLVITMGRLSDKIGRRQLLLLAMGLYAVASALAAFATSPEILLLGRVLIGAAAGAASPAAFSLARSVFTDARHLSIAFAVLMGAWSAGAALGPPMGGLLLEYFWWGAVFLVNVPVAVAVLLAGSWLLPHTPAANGARIDVASVVLSMGAVFGVVFGFQEIADQGVSPGYLLAIAVGAVLGVVFVRRQRRLADPLLDLTLFHIRALRVAAMVLVLTTLAFVSVDHVLIQYLQIVAGVPMATLGFLLAGPGVAAIIGSFLTPVLARRVLPSHIMAAGMVVALAGAAMIVAAAAFIPQAVVPFIVGTTVIALGTTPLMVLSSQLVVTSAPENRAGSAVAVQDVGAGLGGATGMAAIGSLAMAVFSRLLRFDAPNGVSASEVDAAAQSPGGAVAVADQIGGTTGDGLLQVVHDAWSTGTQVAYSAAFLIGVATLVVVLRGLRGVVLPSDDSHEASEDASTTASEGSHDRR